MLSDTPRVVLFGGAASPQRRILVELRYAEVDAAAAPHLFARVARERYGASLVERSAAAASSVFVEYERGGAETFVERIVTGRRMAASMFATTTPNPPLLDELQSLLTRSVIGLDD